MESSIKSYFYQSDRLGVLASTLCLIHCLATPLIFVAQTCAVTCCASAPIWWLGFDYFFLTISFISVRRSSQITKSTIMKYALSICWGLLFILILNESIEVYLVSKNLLYFVAIVLSGLHIYNLHSCQCNNKKCCTNSI